MNKLKVLSIAVLIAVGVLGLTRTAKADMAAANYVNCDCGPSCNSNSGSMSSPWGTVAYALNHVNESRTIRVFGTCHERLVLPSNITITNWAGATRPIIDGTNFPGYPGVFEIWGQHDITLSNLVIRNGDAIPGNSVKGINILAGSGADGVYFTADDVGSHHINIINNDISGIDRSDSPSAYSLPILVSSVGNENLGGSATHHISIVNNYLGESDTDSISLYFPLIQITDNVHDFEIRGNQLVDSDTAGINLSGNESPTAYPNRPYKGVITGNTFVIGGPSSIWLTGPRQILIERNTFRSSTAGVNVYTENDGLEGDFAITSGIWIRNNVFENIEYQSFTAGAIWSSEYCDVSNVYFTNNTIRNLSKTRNVESIGLYSDYAIDPGETQSCMTRCGMTTNECGDLIGDSVIANNIIISDDPTHTNTRALRVETNFTDNQGVRMDFNVWGVYGTSFARGPYNYTFQGFQDALGHELNSRLDIPGTTWFETGLYALLASSTPIDMGSSTIRFPSWATNGYFGDYEPVSEVDYYGNGRESGVIDAGASEYIHPPLISTSKELRKFKLNPWHRKFTRHSKSSYPLTRF